MTFKKVTNKKYISTLQEAVAAPFIFLFLTGATKTNHQCLSGNYGQTSLFSVKSDLSLSRIKGCHLGQVQTK